MRRELEYFFAAVRFFTRLPVPAWVGHSQAQLDHAARYFPLVGAIVGALGALATEGAALRLPLRLAVLIGMATTMLATGAFHEDGFTDSVDGFGGGWEKKRILEIMKDSRVGSFGVVAIAMMLLAKAEALGAVGAGAAPLRLASVLVAGHALSRLAPTVLMYALEYVREDETSKSKPLAKHLSGGELLVAALFGLAPCLLVGGTQVLIGVGLATVSTILAGRFFLRRIGGYTGDCLGASQQVAELAFYVGLLC